MATPLLSTVKEVIPLPIPQPDPLTVQQWKTLLALADTVIPSIQAKPSANSDAVTISPESYTEALATLKKFGAKDISESDLEKYLQENATANPAYQESLQKMFGYWMPSEGRAKLGQTLDILNTRLGSLILTGQLTPIAELPIDVRQSIIENWASSWFPVRRTMYGLITALTKQAWLKTSPSLPKVIDFPRVEAFGDRIQGFDYTFLQFPSGSTPHVIETDVVIVGSGCGGSVCAKNLAEAGHKVMVVEKGKHWTSDHFPMTEQDATNNLFMNGCSISSDDFSMAVVAGQTWGGGGTVNWSASLQTPGYVRKEWADSGLPFFASPSFQTCLDNVCDRMGVSADPITHNFSNRTLLEGARKLGWFHHPVAQNTGGKRHYCGRCTLGCASCEKQGPVVSWLTDAAHAGTIFVENFDAREILFEKEKGQKLATGVRGIWTKKSDGDVMEREVIIKAKKVIVSGGTLQSPLLLLRSGLSNYQIGRNLHLHPVSFLGSIYEEEVKPWEGGILTSVVDEFRDLDHNGHGCKLEATVMLPFFWLVWTPWLSALDFKLTAAQMKHMTGHIAIGRDGNTGQVYPDPTDGRPRIRYTPSVADKSHLLQGILAVAKLNYISGARKIYTTIPGTPVFIRQDGDDPETQAKNDAKFNAWSDEVKRLGFPSNTTFASAHQMGSCRMGSTPKNSVVNFKGEVWGTTNLYVADASVFPSASGVNPMITTMAIADWISKNIAEEISKSAAAKDKL